MSFTFRREVRLRSRHQFLAVQERGRRVSTRLFTMLGQPNDGGVHRLGVVASRKLGGAVMRNRVKRRLREVFRYQVSEPLPNQRPFDVVVIARREIATVPYSQLRADFAQALDRLSKAR